MKWAFSWLLFFFLTSGSAVSPAIAKEKARIRDLTITVDKDSLGVSFLVENCFSPRMEEIVQNGVPVILTSYVRFYQSRSLWRNGRLASLRLTRRILYDNIKKVYQVFLQETGPPVVFEEFEEAKERLTRVEDVRVLPPRPLKERASYYVRVKAELEPARLPFRLGDLLFFVPSGKTQTDWAVQKFRIGFFVVPKQGVEPDA